MKQNKESWDNIYEDGASYMQYPNEALVVSYHRIKNKLPKDVVCLDYGFGSGNNSEFIIDRVKEFYGLEISDSAKEITSKRLNSHKTFDSKNLYVTENKYIKEFENKFDLIVAWHVISYNTDKSVQEVLDYFYKYLKKGGILITSLATPRDISKKHSIEISNNTFKINDNIIGQEDCIVIIPKDKEDFEKYFKNFETIDIGHEERISYKKENDLHSHYYGIFQKV
jgi:SAM-dependent methyltransferase